MEYFFYKWGDRFIQVSRDSRGVISSTYYDSEERKWVQSRVMHTEMKKADRSTIVRYKSQWAWSIDFAKSLQVK